MQIDLSSLMYICILVVIIAGLICLVAGITLKSEPPIPIPAEHLKASIDRRKRGQVFIVAGYIVLAAAVILALVSIIIGIIP